MKKLKCSLAALALVALAACNKAEMPGYLSDPDAVRIEAAVGVLTKSNPLGTVEAQRKFNEGDRISVTNAGETVVYKLNGGTWAPENSGEYLKWDKSDLKFTVEYPVGYTTLPTDQSTLEKLVAADRMCVDATYSDIPGTRILSAGLVRKNVLVKIKIAGYLDQYKEGKTFIEWLSIGKDWPGNQASDAYMVSQTLVLDKDGKTPLKQYYYKGTVGNMYTAIVRPNKKDDNSDKNFIVMRITGKGADKDTGDFLVVKGGQELEAGHAYTFELYVGKNTVKIGDITVNEWTTGATLPDGETDQVDTWDGQTTEAFAVKDASGNDLGTSETNPILIRTGAQLAYLAQQVNGGESYSGKFFKLTDDLNLAGKSWTPIGRGNTDPSKAKPFSGIFDGGNCYIDGLKFESTEEDGYIGLFGYISGASVKNLKVSSASITTKGDYVAILCGLADKQSSIADCIVNGSVEVEGRIVGGIVGSLDGSSVSKCVAEVNVKGSRETGGLCGESRGVSTITGCIVSAGSSIGVMPDKKHISLPDTPVLGGLVGFVTISGASTIKDNVSYASVSGFGNVAGLFGKIATFGHAFSSCTAYGDVTVTAGQSKSQKNNCGGLVGYLYDYDSRTPTTFADCGYNGYIKNEDSAVTGVIGGGIGLDDSKATFTDCWYNADKTGEFSSVGKGVNDKDYTGIKAKNLGK